MHDPAAEHGETVFDFGVTALGASFHGDWVLDAQDELDHVRTYLGTEGDPAGLVLLIEDLLRLRDSGLDDDELAVLWHATDPPLGGAPVIRGAARTWLDRLLAVVVPSARARGASEASCTTYVPCAGDGTTTSADIDADAGTAGHRRLMPEVVELIALLDPRAEGHEPVDAVRGALVRCAETVCPELAFRFLLHAANGFWSRLTPETFGRLERVSAAFGHGPHVVDAVRYLVD
ncbi:hypothetical protein [Streptomyces ficellus]|uniref:CdiI immunity protein domain-containing protein n=1 Tax=Streptomyces ficellus TaxID=1977088 RepID=A0A6I6F3P3_9ACTN|nr:hypothetical protein [Streptomyces ficellus]QGV77294.1 hypothetical protein EIZ62_02760 [Streptomyces ficellus]